MKRKNTRGVASNKSIVRIAKVVGLILLVPLALTIRDGGVEGVGWNWRLGDFIVMGTLLFCTGLALDLAVRKVTNPVFRVFAVLAILAALFMIWVELAVDGVSQAIGLFF